MTTRVLDRDGAEIKVGDLVLWGVGGEPWHVVKISGGRIYIAPDEDFTPGDWIVIDGKPLGFEAPTLQLVQAEEQG
jgi:hypothetical protein